MNRVAAEDRNLFPPFISYRYRLCRLLLQLFMRQVRGELGPELCNSDSLYSTKSEAPPKRIISIMVVWVAEMFSSTLQKIFTTST